ncbi:MAG: [LysW]-lysine hydrolase [Candidatus Tectomicrobia bacterium]|uniref:[LysW]-lysine hydrolase n=1 Tax=Tectimicrobiota bacterium TaxID=2528274 RepID=A0A937W0X0_UNCTE|nr:[LysW]-lysine hydrolase [Candidatus Tectomicrobia bacterium]
MNQDIALLRELVSIASPSTEEQAASAYLVEAMRARGYDDAFVDEAGNAVGIWGQGEQEIVLLGHIDTVPGDIPVRQEGNILYGRGTVDAKGPLACFTAAVARLPKRADCRLVVIGAVEEEAASSKGARHVVERYHPTCFVIGEPSQWQAVTLGYKGRLLIDYTLRHDMSHSAGQLPSGPELAVGFWNTLVQHATAFNEGRAIFDMLDTSLRSIQTSSDGLQEVVTQRIGLRLPLEYDIATLKTYLCEQAGAATLHFSGYEIAHKSDKRNPLVKAFLKAIRECGGEPKFKVKTGTSDMNVLAPHWACPVVAYGPGDSSLDHTPHEHIDLQEYQRAIDVLTRVLQLLVTAPAAA